MRCCNAHFYRCEHVRRFTTEVFKHCLLMPNKHQKTHEIIREALSPEALSRGRQLYLSSGVRELRIDVRRRRYSAIIDDMPNVATVKIEYGKDGPSWMCSTDGRSNPNCAHVAALLTGIREREASEGRLDHNKGEKREAGHRVSLVEHLVSEAERDHLIQAFRLCLRTYPELQGDLVFTILENIDKSGELYDEVVGLMDDPSSSKDFSLPKEGFDPYRLLDEINYLFEQEKYEQCFLLSRAMMSRYLAKMAKGITLVDFEVDLVIASSGMLSDLTIPPAPEQLATQVHELGMRLLRRFPKLEPQIQSSLIALIDDESLTQEDLEELEKSLRRRWERARKVGKKPEHLEEAERLAMPLALFYARTTQFDKLQNLFDRYLQNPLLRAPALAEMLHHNLQDIVVEYVLSALVEPSADVHRDDPEDIARCGMYNDLVMMLLETIVDPELQERLLRKAFLSIGHRIYGILEVYKEEVEEKQYKSSLEQMGRALKPLAKADNYAGLTKYFVLLCEMEDFDAAYELHVDEGNIDPVILLDYLPNFLPKYSKKIFDAALESLIQLMPLVSEDGLRELVSTSISLLWDIDEEKVREALDMNFADILDDELADFIDVLLGDLEDDEIGL